MIKVNGITFYIDRSSKTSRIYVSTNMQYFRLDFIDGWNRDRKRMNAIADRIESGQIADFNDLYRYCGRKIIHTPMYQNRFSPIY